MSENKIRVDVWIHPNTYVSLIQHKNANGFKNISQASENAIKNYFAVQFEQKQATDRLNKVIQDLVNKNNNLELEIRQFKQKKLKKPKKEK